MCECIFKIFTVNQASAVNKNKILRMYPGKLLLLQADQPHQHAVYYNSVLLSGTYMALTLHTGLNHVPPGGRHDKRYRDYCVVTITLRYVFMSSHSAVIL